MYVMQEPRWVRMPSEALAEEGGLECAMCTCRKVKHMWGNVTLA
jgi:hypothetical protein